MSTRKSLEAWSGKQLDSRLVEAAIEYICRDGAIFVFLSGWDEISKLLDCGKTKETSYDALNKLAFVFPSWISKASAHQRQRVQPGVCYRVLPSYQTLELVTVVSFLEKAFQPPSPLPVQNAIELSKTIRALDDMEELTPLRGHLCSLPLYPNNTKMLLMGQCLDPAALTHHDPFVLPLNRKEETDAAKR
ncbi:hypothetical protein GIB67_010468 [Kingdonia uniflora]|uniref:Uncharacterized protein n=1 Tax=Kingdonia uniflora TaxID=39325 RepID=A0A7J7MAS6_9MAGN|nr:hypothetical protein GIB67_010468 [Kingdonia uniflora]